MNSGNSGYFTRSKYDSCTEKVDLRQKVGPLEYTMFAGKYEHCGKCVKDENSFFHPYDTQIIDGDSELRGITRRYSRCPTDKFTPGCDKSATCTSTFDKSNPIVLPHEACPIVQSNLVRPTGPGYSLNTDLGCKRRS